MVDENDKGELPLVEDWNIDELTNAERQQRVGFVLGSGIGGHI